MVSRSLSKGAMEMSKTTSNNTTASTTDHEERLERANEFWMDYVETFSHPLTANGLVGRFVQNTEVTGAYAESWIRSLVSDMCGKKYRVSTGAIIRGSDRAFERDLTNPDVARAPR